MLFVACFYFLVKFGNYRAIILLERASDIMANKEDLTKAKKEKNDEFYTELTDIDKELRYYTEHFKDKIVFCNCDDPYESNFFKYFALNFNHLGLKKLICTCYAGSPVVSTQLSLFDIEGLVIKKEFPKTAYKIEITEVNDFDGDGTVNLSDIEYLLKNKKNTLTLLNGNGDFRSKECVELLKQSDVVVTNPPFSLFREYIAQLIKYNKKFLVLSNMNAITYRDFFPYLKKNKIWAGYGFNLSMVYKTPYPNLLESNRKYVLSKGYNPDEGYVKVPGISWFTNLEITKRHESLILYKKYTPEEYPHYDNYDAINVDKVTDIPCDYYNEIGVPITFLDKYNPEQFKITGLGHLRGNFTPNKFYKNAKKHKKNGEIVSGESINSDLTIKVYEKPINQVYYTSDEEGYLIVPYARMLIQKIDNSSEGEVYEDKVA